MTFLTPLPAILTACVAIPLLVLLYVLKLRREPVRLASTLLWMKSVEDLQVNAPFQRLRLTALFLLQLLALLLFLVALARPTVNAALRVGARVVVVIDRSASMNASPGPDQPTRLERAKRAAREAVGRISSASSGTEIMVIGFARNATVYSTFQSSEASTLAAIDAIVPTDEAADFASAARLINAFATSTTDESRALPEVLLFSDGGVASTGDPSGWPVLRAARVDFIPIGTEDALPNTGVVAMSARRPYEAPETVEVFVRAGNASPSPVDVVLTLRRDGAVVSTSSLSLPGATIEGPGLADRTFELTMQEAGVLTVLVSGEDALDADQAGSLVMPEPRAPNILIVAPGGAPDPFLEAILRAMETEQVRAVGMNRYAEMLGSDEGLASVDMVVVDRLSLPSVPPAPSLWFGAAPPNVLTEVSTSPEGGARIMSWDRQHPIMRYVSLDPIVFSGFAGFIVPEDDAARYEVLATGPQGPVIVGLERRNNLHVFVGFKLINSNWPAEVSLAVFLQNVVDRAVYGGRVNDGISYSPGETVVLEPLDGVETLVVRGPVEESIPIQSDAGRVTIAAPRLAGLYEVAGLRPSDDILAVNVASVGETDIRVVREVPIRAQQLSTKDTTSIGPRELWPWFVAAGLLVLMIEWVIYVARTRV